MLAMPGNDNGNTKSIVLSAKITCMSKESRELGIGQPLHQIMRGRPENMKGVASIVSIMRNGGKPARSHRKLT